MKRGRGGGKRGAEVVGEWLWGGGGGMVGMEGGGGRRKGRSKRSLQKLFSPTDTTGQAKEFFCHHE